MMRSMFSGVSGLRAHQTRMDVIGNNISNVNTVGYKSGRVTFQEIYSQTLRGAGAPDNSTGRGGMNPMQVGLGITVASVDNLFTRGSFQRTDNPFDLAIDGEGFFIAKTGGESGYKFTRAGNFGLDQYGNLTTANGDRVMGWQERVTGSTRVFDTEKELSAINIYTDEYNGNKKVIAAQPTTRAVLGGNLDSSLKLQDLDNDPTTATEMINGNTNTYDVITDKFHGAETFKVPYVMYDKLGNDYTVTLTFAKNKIVDGTTTDPKTEWFFYGVEEQTQIAMDNDKYNNQDPPPNPLKYPATAPADVTPFQGYITFDKNGKPISVAGVANDKDPNNELATDLKVDNPREGTDPFTISVDFTNLTMFKTDSSVKATDVDGYPPGKFVTAEIGPDGIITAIYSNGQQQSVGQLALAWFENPAGLQKVGNNMFVPSANSGDFTKGAKPGNEGTGALSSGTLEMSNVDLSKEFTDMITTQRGFQANSRIITTSDEMLQELVNLKR